MPKCRPPLQLNISRDGPELKAQCVQIEIFGAVSCLKSAERPVGGRSQRVAARVALIVRPVQSVTFDAVQRRDQVTEFKFVDERQSVRQTLDAVSRLQRPPRHDPRSNLARNFQISTAIVFFKFGAKCHAILSSVDNQFDGATFSSEIIETRQTSIGLRRTRSLSFLSSNSSRRSASVAQHFNKTKQKRTVRNNFHRKTVSLFHRKLTNLSAQTN